MRYGRLITGMMLAFSVMPVSARDKDFKVSEEQQRVMTAEADDFIDAMPEGLQDRQRIAVEHAIRGDLSSLREIRRQRNVAADLPENVETKDIVAASGAASGIPMRLYRPVSPAHGKLPLLVYYHGGGWTFGSINSCSRFCAEVAATGEALVLAVDYALAPENSFPAGLLDCVAAAEYASEHASEWGSDPSLVSLGGDSSGGNLASAAAMMLAHDREEGKGAEIRSLVLFYPVVSNTVSREGSSRKYGKGYGLDSNLMESFIEAYSDEPVKTLDGGKGFDGLMEPLEADEEVWRKLPPMLVVQAGRDILFDQGREYVERSRKMGLDVERVEFSGAVHLFITVEGQPTAFRKAVDMTAAFLK